MHFFTDLFEKWKILAKTLKYCAAEAAVCSSFKTHLLHDIFLIYLAYSYIAAIAAVNI